MTLITRWEPFREFSVLQDRMNRLFQNNLAGGRDEELAANTGFAPAVDVYEDEHNITLKLEVPGIDEKDIDIRLENHTLTVRGERKFEKEEFEKEEKEENFHRIERRYGSFFRSFTLPTVVDSENVKADYEKGVLKISLAKKAEAKPKQIKVSIGQKTLESKPEPSKAEGKSEAKSEAKSAGKAA